jgi:putative pyruvate formate lyase activating enzyme
MIPSYTFLHEDEWDERIARADERARSCTLCPRRCGVDRTAGERGFCGAGDTLCVSSLFAHHGEEPPISGTGGSGTVFFTWCTLRCAFCQNYQLSHQGEGSAYDVHELAGRLGWLREQGCHNINLVTPTHFLPRILRALRIAARHGLDLPIVYNCGGYELAETLALLEGIVDIYLPDMKYGDNAAALRYSGAPDYVEHNRRAIREMFRQVGPLRLDAEGVATRGVCIRHLVLPEGAAGSEAVLSFLTSTFDPDDISMSIMAQYRPCHQAHRHPAMSRGVRFAEYEPVRKAFVEAGFKGYFQELRRMDESFLIDFRTRKSERLR